MFVSRHCSCLPLARWVDVAPRQCCFACHWKRMIVERSKQTLPAFLDKAFSKSLDVVTPFERMARWVAFSPCFDCHW